MSHNKLLFIGLPVLMLCVLVSAGVYGILRFRTKVSEASRVDVLVAARDLRAGEQIEERDIQVANLPVNTLPQGCIGDKSLALGHTVMLPVAKGDLICRRNLAVEDEHSFTQPDMRAVLVPANEIVGSTGLVKRGTHVDVLLSLEPRGRRERTITVLKNARVIALAQEPENNSVGLHQMASVFLLLSPDDAQKLARLRRHGKIRLSVLNGFPDDGSF
jgi:pilus assembly protein CpaB